ncbi:MAG: ABC-type dipeptide transport system, periplasmic component [Acidobacteria bacterium]|nr:ABC-type dipeptide transport system, periplasmic component [Acidobacteriota bacterium]
MMSATGSRRARWHERPGRGRWGEGEWLRSLSLALVVFLLLMPLGCRRKSTAFVIALSDNIRTIDPIGAPSVEAASERVRSLMFNSLVKKDAKFDYVGELAENIQRSDDGLTYTFTLHDGVKFHDNRPLTSADAKYTLDLILEKEFAKAASFFEGSGADKKRYVKSVAAPDPKTLVVTLNKPWMGLLSNLVPVPIIPKDSYATQKDHPVGTGPFKFVSYDSSQQVVDLAADDDYWEGPPQIKSLRVRVISDANAMQAELLSGRVDIAPLPTSLSPDAIKALGGNSKLQVVQFPGSNLVLLTFNVSEPPLNDVRVRQAICYAIDREGMIRDLLLGQGKLAHSILPEESWAYTPGQKYSYDPAEAKRLLDEAGFKDPLMRFSKPLVFRISGSSTQARNVAGIIQSSLKQVGIPVSIESAETNTHFQELRRGHFQLAYGQWVGGNQDPIFYKDLFATSEIPTETRASKNRSRYSSAALDPLLEEAVNTFDRQKTLPLYVQIQAMVSHDAPILPLWYQANMVIAKQGVGNIHVDASGDWGFVRNLTVK